MESQEESLVLKMKAYSMQLTGIKFQEFIVRSKYLFYDFNVLLTHNFYHFIIAEC